MNARRYILVGSFTWYALICAALLAAHLSSEHTLGFDGWLYREASAAWLSGRDPWQVGASNAHYAGTPTTILAFVAATLLPGEIWRVASIALAGAAAVFALRRARLPLYWLVYPPLFISVLLGQPTVLIAALLVSPLAFAAPLVKAIGGLPLLWRPNQLAAAALCGAAAIVAAPALWATWLARLPELSARLQAELHGGSPWWLVALGALALVVIVRLRPEHAPWLAISALWPLPEYHYAVLALPTAVPLLLLGLALVPGQVPVVIYAGWLLVARRFPNVRRSIDGPSETIPVSGASAGRQGVRIRRPRRPQPADASV